MVKPCPVSFASKDLKNILPWIKNKNILKTGKGIIRGKRSVGIITNLRICSGVFLIWLSLFLITGSFSVLAEIEIPEGEKYYIIINTYQRTLTLYKDGKPYKRYPVAIGKPTTRSPVGEWAIIGKSKDWGGGFGTRWLGLNVPWGIYGIHGTNKPGSIGRAASHGCIRMFNRDVEELYDIVPVKTRVKIIGRRIPITVNRILKTGYDRLIGNAAPG